TLDLPGGVDRLLHDRSLRLREAGLVPLVLRPDGRLSCRLSADHKVLRDLSYRVPGDLPALGNFLAGLALDHIEIHHFLHHDDRVIELVRALGPPLDVYVHDYGWICPRITLIGSAGTYCGEPSLKTCEICIAKNGSLLPTALTAKKLRQRSRTWLG